MVERGLEDAMRAMLLRRDDECDLKLAHITNSIRVMPHSSRGKIPYFLMLDRNLRLPNKLVNGWLEPGYESKGAHAVQLSKTMQITHDKLKALQQAARGTEFTGATFIPGW